MADVNPAPPPLSPPDLFRQYVSRSAEAARLRIDPDAPVMADDVRERALHTLGFAMQEETAWLTAQQLARAMAPKMERAGYREDWAPYLRRGAAISRALGDAGGEADFYWRLGWLYQLRGDLSTAQDFFELCRARFEAMGARRRLAATLNRLAFIACVTDAYDQALDLSRQGLALLAPDDPDRAMHLNLLGRVAYVLADWTQARDYMGQALALREAEGDPHKIASNLRDYALVLYEMRELDEAVTVGQRAIALFEALRDQVELAATTSNLGLIHQLRGQLDEALALYQRARALFWEVGGGIDLSVVCKNIGSVHIERGEWSMAEEALVAGLEEWPVGVRPLTQGELFIMLGIAMYKQGRHAEGIDFLGQAVAVAEDFPDHPGAVAQKALAEEHLAVVRKLARTGH